mmetsp:Transcript_28986/g.52458  ORF Transcript_28986/g.52458 Transcript_28986/m.52458 type:complete len:135 (+) Transcript_28986:94-498(+)
MQRFILYFLSTTVLLSGMASSYGIAPRRGTKTPLSRRHLLDRIVSFGSGAALVGFVVSPALASEKIDDKTETTEEKKKRELKEKIAASKKNFRTADDYAKERFTTVDYSCVASTGSPCKDPKSVFPSDGQLEDL